MGKQIISIIALCFVMVAHAQKTSVSFKQVDSTTYAQYLKQDWKQLLKVGKISRSEGVDFYYLKVRMGIAYFKEGEMLSAVKLLEEANKINSYDVVVQEYLYWAYRYSGLLLESRLFYDKLAKKLQQQINLDLPFVTTIDFSIVATSNTDYDAMLGTDKISESGDVRYVPENFQHYSLGMNHPLSKKVNLYHRLSIMPTASVQQENDNGTLVNTTYSGNETRYYADLTFSLGNRWYLDTYFNTIFGRYDNFNSTVDLSSRGPRDGMTTASSSSSIRYTDVVFGATLTKASYYVRNSVNVSVSNLNGYNQFQAGYTVSLYPLGNTLLVPFGVIQYQNEDPDTNVVYTGGVSINTKSFSITGYGNIGDLHNFVANNGSVIYNQSATALNEYGLTIQFYTKNAIVKFGYSFMEMEDHYYDQNLAMLTKTFNFNQQNITGGILWKF